MHRHIGSIEVLSLRRLRAIELLRANRLEESDDELAVSVEAIGSVRDLLIDLCKFTASKTRPSHIPGLSLRKGTASERRGTVRLGLPTSIRRSGRVQPSRLNTTVIGTRARGAALRENDKY